MAGSSTVVPKSHPGGGALPRVTERMDPWGPQCGGNLPPAHTLRSPREPLLAVRHLFPKGLIAFRIFTESSLLVSILKIFRKRFLFCPHFES